MSSPSSPVYHPTSPVKDYSPTSPFYDPENKETNVGLPSLLDTKHNSFVIDLSKDSKNIYEDMLTSNDFPLIDEKERIANFHLQSLESVSGISPQQQVPLAKSKSCRYYQLGMCKFGSKCFFSHEEASKDNLFSDSIFIPRPRKNKCKVSGCIAFARLDICQDCCEQFSLCEKRPCPNYRTLQGKEPTLCSNCYEEEKLAQLAHPRMCRNPKCGQPCLSFYTHCRTCFKKSKEKRGEKCQNEKCLNRVSNPVHRFCSKCYKSTRSYHPYRKE